MHILIAKRMNPENHKIVILIAKMARVNVRVLSYSLLYEIRSETTEGITFTRVYDTTKRRASDLLER